MEEEIKLTPKEALQQKAQKFLSDWNVGGHDWIFQESELYYEEENVLFVAYCREYCVYSDENAYSLVYAFTESGVDRIYYNKFYDAHPEWRDAKQFIRTLVSAKRDGDYIIISTKTEDGTPKELKYNIS